MKLFSLPLYGILHGFNPLLLLNCLPNFSLDSLSIFSGFHFHLSPNLHSNSPTIFHSKLHHSSEILKSSFDLLLKNFPPKYQISLRLIPHLKPFLIIFIYLKLNKTRNLSPFLLIRFELTFLSLRLNFFNIKQNNLLVIL